MYKCIATNNIINKFLLAGDKFMPEMHLKQPLDLPLVVVGHLNSDPPFYVIFCCFLRLIRPPSQVKYFLILLWVVFCVIISWVTRRKYENLLPFNSSRLVSLRTWYYFRLCFSLSCSGYDLKLIKTSHTLNCYSFLQKIFLKTKTYKLLL